MTEKDWVHILQLPADASCEDVRKAYKRLVRQWHPDQFACFPERERAAQEKLKEINIAYRKAVSFMNSRSTLPAGSLRPSETEHASFVSRLIQKLGAFFSFQPPGADRKPASSGQGTPAKKEPKFEDTLKKAMADQRPATRKTTSSRPPVRTARGTSMPVAKRGARIEKIRPVRPVSGV